MCRLSSREKISLQDLSKERRPGGAGGSLIRDEDEGEEAPAGRDTRLWAWEGAMPGFLGLQLSKVASISYGILFLFLCHRAPTCGTKSPQWCVFPCVLQPQEPRGESEHPELK